MPHFGSSWNIGMRRRKLRFPDNYQLFNVLVQRWHGLTRRQHGRTRTQNSPVIPSVARDLLLGFSTGRKAGVSVLTNSRSLVASLLGMTLIWHEGRCAPALIISITDY